MFLFESEMYRKGLYIVVQNQHVFQMPQKLENLNEQFLIQNELFILTSQNKELMTYKPIAVTQSFSIRS